ncbi:MAG TPA: hypothetical protein VNX01_09175 [Bacteroidia bacterium]|jgi:hypothetical protein|nr:hypothetical protein [Bacteroidia bacterium]
MLFSLSGNAKNDDELVFKNKGFAILLCAFNEIENPIKAQITIILYVTNVLM